MTMPDERTRSLRWGYEFLSEIVADESIDEAMRARAQHLLPTYPRPEEILELIEADATSLPQATAQCLAESAELFWDLQISGQGTIETRKSMIYVRRHFPEPNIALALGALSQSNRLRRWLLPEDYDWSGKSS